MSDSGEQRSPSRLRLLAVLVVVLIPLIPVAIGLSLSGGTSAATTTASAAHFTVVGTTPRPSAPSPPPAPAAPSPPSRPSVVLPAGPGALVAVVDHRTPLSARPGGRVMARVPARTPFGSPQVMWVRRVSGHWLGVVSVLAGNNHLGWMPAADASLTRVTWELRVSLAKRRLTVLDNGHPLEHFTIAVGAPASPTPTGRFAVTDRLKTGDPAGPYGCCILALSAVAPHAIADWTGGNRIAIHSTPETWTIGDDVSHGCMRLTLPEGRWLIDHIPLGTPTIISS